MSTCPDCGSNFTRRVPRTLIMRCIPGTLHILCTDCGERSFVFARSRAKGGQKLVVRQPIAPTARY